jgi:hypothetical protein
MATESMKSTRPGDAEFKPKQMAMSSGDRAQAIMNGGKCGGTKGGVTNEQRLSMGRTAAKAAANGKGY